MSAWASIVEDEQKKSAYKSARGKGGMVRTTWEEAAEIISASMLYTIKQYGPDRIFGFPYPCHVYGQLRGRVAFSVPDRIAAAQLL